MRKAQSLIIQFILFFAMGFTLFVTVGFFFKLQSETYRDEVANYSLGLTDSYFSSAAISAIDTCKQCDYSSYSLKIENVTAGYFLDIELDSLEGLKIRAVPRGKIFSSRVYNLNESFKLAGLAASVKSIDLTFNKTKNELRVE